MEQLTKYFFGLALHAIAFIPSLHYGDTSSIGARKGRRGVCIDRQALFEGYEFICKIIIHDCSQCKLLCKVTFLIGINLEVRY